MSRFCFFLFLFVSFFANAQDGPSFYPDALIFNGDVLTVKMYSRCTKGEKCELADIEYVYDEGVRVVRTYDSLPNKEIRDNQRIVETLKKNSKEDKTIVYLNGFHRLEALHYSYDEQGNKTLTGATVSILGYKSVLNFDKTGRVIKKVVTDKHKAITDITTYTYSDNGRTIEIVTTNAVGKVIAKAIRKLDGHNNTIFSESENIVKNEKHTTKFKYVYDLHGNYTSYTSVTNGEPAYSHYREITYK